jgi:hypothetical protein
MGSVSAGTDKSYSALVSIFRLPNIFVHEH